MLNDELDVCCGKHSWNARQQKSPEVCRGLDYRSVKIKTKIVPNNPDKPSPKDSLCGFLGGSMDNALAFGVNFDKGNTNEMIFARSLFF
jgi:hypothetical protein